MNTGIGTNINALGLSFLFLMGLLLLFLPRRYATIPIISTVTYLTIGQTVDVAAINFHALRIIILFGWIRLVFRGEIFSVRMTVIDKAVIGWVLASIIISHMSWQGLSGTINRLGFAYNVVGVYYLFRFLVRDPEDMMMTVRYIAVLILPLALFMTLEWTTGRNAFAVFGGVPDVTMVRGGRFRCQGPFRHPILAGTVGATLFPLFACLWLRDRSHRFLATLAMGGAMLIMILSASSGPLMAFITVIIGYLLWPLRRHMRTVTWGIVLSLAALHMMMKAPIWFVIGRLSSLTGGTGWHRSELIDQAIKHVNEWWLSGTSYTAHWAFDTGLAVLPDVPDMIDITNQYVLIAVNGGLLPLILFILVLILSFRGLGKVLRVESTAYPEMIMAWSLGVALFANAVSFISVSYFDQTIAFWYLLLAMIAMYSDHMIQVKETAPAAAGQNIHFKELAECRVAK